MDRKVLTLEEIISLNRRPTLQEVVDLAAESVEDYAEYLNHIGVLKYVPENLYDYETDYDVDDDYDVSADIVLDLLEELIKIEMDEGVYDEKMDVNKIQTINEKLDNCGEYGEIQIDEDVYRYYIDENHDKYTILFDENNIIKIYGYVYY